MPNFWSEEKGCCGKNHCPACGGGDDEHDDSRAHNLHCCAICDKVICDNCGWGKNLAFCHSCNFSPEQVEKRKNNDI